jgi:hypothetical protein
MREAVSGCSIVCVQQPEFASWAPVYFGLLSNLSVHIFSFVCVCVCVVFFQSLFFECFGTCLYTYFQKFHFKKRKKKKLFISK